MLVVLTEHPQRRQQISAHLFSHGILHYAEGFDNALSLCEEKDVGGLLLDATVGLCRAERLCAMLKERYPEMPICAVVSPSAVPNMPTDCLLRWNTEEQLAREALEFAYSLWGTQQPILSARYLYVRYEPPTVLYMGYPLALSPRERSLLWCLLFRAPRVTSTDDLLHLCHVSSRKSLTVLISNVNKKAQKIHPRTLILNAYQKGYVLHSHVL